MLAEAFYECRDFKKAESLYKEAIQVRKQCGKVVKKSDSGSVSSEEGLLEDGRLALNASDVEVKYKLHTCYLMTNQMSQAVHILQSIPAKQRSVKCNLALGKLYKQSDTERPAIACFKEVLKVCPMALEASIALMELGVKPREISELMLDINVEWLNLWIQGLSAFYNHDYTNAIQSLKQLEESNPMLRNNLHLLVTLGRAHHYSGNFPAAATTLQRVHRLDPNHLSGMDILAVLMAKERKLKELEQLANRLMSVTEEAPEAWIAMGKFTYKKSLRSKKLALKKHA